jgi:hypothetical protein
MRLPEGSLCEPRVRVALVVQEALDLLAAVQQPRVRGKLISTGVSSQRVDSLEPAIEALRVAQSQVLRARCPDEDFVEALSSALDLRDEMVAACLWNLRHREVGASLVRITDSTDGVELAMDLRELVQLLDEHAIDFESDRTFHAVECVRQASALADELTATLDQPVPLPTLELRDRAFTHLLDVIDEVRSAGRHAYRGRSEARSLFASELQPRRRRSPLTSLVRSLAG